MDVIVTLPKKRGGLIHLGEKQAAFEINEIPYWEMKRLPVKLDKGDKLFILTEGFIRGYFIVEYIDDDKEHDGNLKIYLSSWTDIKHIKMRGFQGFRYRDFNYQEVD